MKCLNSLCILSELSFTPSKEEWNKMKYFLLTWIANWAATKNWTCLQKLAFRNSGFDLWHTQVQALVLHPRPMESDSAFLQAPSGDG